MAIELKTIKPLMYKQIHISTVVREGVDGRTEFRSFNAHAQKNILH